MMLSQGSRRLEHEGDAEDTRIISTKSCRRSPRRGECRQIRTRLASMAQHDHDDHHHGSELSETQLRVRALETVLTEKGYVDPAALDAIIEAYETKVGPHNGARVVAKAWADPAFKQALLDDASKAVSALGHESRVGDHLVAVENTPQHPQHGRVHAVLLLSVGGARPAAGLVQIRALPLARGQGPARRARRFRRQAAEGDRDQGLGFDGGDPVSRACRCARPAPTAGARKGSPRWSRATP